MTLEEAEQRLAQEPDAEGEEGEEPPPQPEGEEPTVPPGEPAGLAPEPPSPPGGLPPTPPPAAPAGPAPEATEAPAPGEEPPMGGPPGGDEEPMGQPEPAAPQPALDAPAPGTTSVGQFLSSTIHAGFTLAADRVFGAGYLTEQERIALASAISRALQAFSQTMQQEHPELHGREMPTSVALGSNHF